VRLLRRLRARAAAGTTPTAERTVVVVGLRNPGADYAETRHNLGFKVVSAVAERAGVTLGRGPARISAQVATVRLPASPALLVAPIGFMNESGRVVRSVLDYWKVATTDLLVVHDDIDLAFGRLRLQVAGGTGGHNGVRSVERSLGTRDFSRLKVGVGRPPGSVTPADHVLRPFTKGERPEVGLIVEDAADVVEEWVEDRSRAQEMAAHRGRDG
jgi:peptidyl-tRNA hydrolase, PTH1 family